MNKLNDLNENNPTVNWTEEKYEFGKWGHKWVEQLSRNDREGGFIRNPRNPSNPRTVKHQCSFCDYASNKKSRITCHLSVHGIGERYQCDQCDKDFGQKQNLKRHIERQHETEVKVFECDQCNTKYTTQKDLKRHIRSIHDKEKFSCKPNA